jgi:accessory gene regulator B
VIKKTALAMSVYFANKKFYSEEKKNVYAYGFELLISTILNALGVLIVALIMENLAGALLFSLAFISLRITAGGYHAKKYLSCFLIFIIVFILFTILIDFIDGAYSLHYVIFSCLISSSLVWLFSPVEAKNKPLGEKQKERLKKRSLITMSIIMALTMTYIFLPDLPLIYLEYFMSGALAASLSLVVAIFTIKIKDNSKQNT